MLNPKIEGAFNAQINAELYSSYLYLSMSAYFESKSLPGMAHWMRLQAQEEAGHAMKMFDFVNERNGRVLLKAVDAPATEWASPLAVFEVVYEHECKVTGLINDLTSLALEEKDHAAGIFLQWFVTEQVEEEANALAIVDKLKLVGDQGVPLYMLDKELGQRTVSPAAAE
ncbi:MAG: ferritin [Pirellulales bacterium]|nr:ferritin [Pirellulales bacterium]